MVESKKPPGVITVVVVCGGERPDAAELPSLPADAVVIAADSGVDHARALGLTVHRVVGDCDSASPEGLAWAESTGAVIERHPEEKDATDLELALTGAAGLNPRQVIVIGGGGGRLDHLLGNLTLLAHPLLANTMVTAYLPDARVTVVRNRATVEGEPGDLLSLVPVGGDAEGIRTEGLQYPLVDEDLPAGTSRGISNVMLGREATVTVAKGTLLAIQPRAGQP